MAQLKFYLSISVRPSVCKASSSAFCRVNESLSNSIKGVGLFWGSVVPDCLSNYPNEGGKFDYKSAVRNK